MKQVAISVVPNRIRLGFHGEGVPLGVMYPSYPYQYGYLALH